MRDQHLTVFQLLQVYEGHRSPRELSDFVLRHLRALCPECDASFGQYTRALERRRQRLLQEADYRPAVEQATVHAAQLAARLAEDEARAPQEVAVLLKGPVGTWQRRIEKARTRYRSPAVVERLLEAARGTLRHQPADAFDYLDAARAVAERLNQELYGESLCSDLRVRIEAHRANALRVLGELRGADALWVNLQAHLRHQPVTDDLLLAELASLEASLRQDQRRYPEAQRLLGQAERRYRALEDRGGLVKILTQRGAIARLQNKPGQALEHLAEAGAWVDTAATPGLAWMVLHNRALSLCDLGRFEEAEAHIRDCRPLAARVCRPSDQARQEWLLGRVAAGTRRAEEAEKHFGTARNLFLRSGMLYDAALVGFDLAELFLRTRRPFEVKRLTQQMIGTFESQRVATHLERSLILLRQAATTEAITLELLAELRRHFQAPRRPNQATL
ncbi:MAG: hypothetical protein AAF604_23260 [Acidobacteriota bacterium]